MKQKSVKFVIAIGKSQALCAIPLTTPKEEATQLHRNDKLATSPTSNEFVLPKSSTFFQSCYLYTCLLCIFLTERRI